MAYEAGMMQAHILADRRVQEFLHDPPAHAYSLRLMDREMKLPELDLLCRLLCPSPNNSTMLKELHLDSVNLTDEHVSKLANSIERFEGLEVLSLNYNKIADSGCMTLASRLKEIRSLTSLSLDGNRISAAGTVAIATCVEKLCNLSILSISHNSIGDYGAYALAIALTKNSPAAYDWEPDVPGKPRSSAPSVYVSLGRKTALQARGIAAASAAGLTLSGRLPLHLQSQDDNSDDDDDAPPPPPLLGPPSGAKKRQTIIPPPRSLPPRQTVIPPPPPIGLGRAAIIRRSVRASHVAPPPGGMSLKKHQASESGDGRDNGPSRGHDDFLEMVIEEDEEAEDGKETEERIKAESNAALKKGVLFGGKKNALTDKLAQKKKEKKRKLLSLRCSKLWVMLRCCTFFLGRLMLLKRGNVPLSLLSCANVGVSPLGIQWLLHACKFNGHVDTVNLADNKVDLESVAIISEYLGWIDTLDEIILDGNVVGDRGVQVLLKGLEMNKSVSNFSMDRCNLSAVSLNWIASFTDDFYVDNLTLVRDSGVKTARMKVEDYVKDIVTMGSLVVIGPEDDDCEEASAEIWVEGNDANGLKGEREEMQRVNIDQFGRKKEWYDDADILKQEHETRPKKNSVWIP